MRTVGLCVSLSVLLISCAVDEDSTRDDDLAEGSTGLEGKADGLALAGSYRWTSDSAMWNNDIAALQVTGSQYVRARCYGYDCAKLVPEYGEVLVVHASGKAYLRFKSFTKKLVGEEWIEEPVTADTYQIEVGVDSLRLRKTYTNRWFTLTSLAPEPLCEASGGDWTEGACVCSSDHGDWSHYTGFFPGLGGCFEIHAANEDGCAETRGSYLDDDGNMIGTYCHCPLGTYETNDGCQAI